MATISKRISQDGSISYQAKVRLKGYPVQSETFTRKTDAARWAAGVESAIREGRHFKTSEAKRHTLGDLVDRYVRDVLPQKRDGKKQEAQLLWWKNQIGAYTLADVTPALIAEHRDRLYSDPQKRGVYKLSPATVSRYMAALSVAMNVCVMEWGWLEDSPMRRVTKPREPRGRVRFLSDQERNALLNACRSHAQLYPVVVLALSTGMRQAEIMNLYWKDPKDEPSNAWGVVHLDSNRIILHETKNGERRVVPLVGHAHDQLKAINKVRRIDTELVFPAKKPPRGKLGEEQKSIRPIDLRKPWEDALTAAEIDDFHFHDLRHSAASYLAMNGASLAEIAETLGHKTLQMVKRYAHLSEAHTAGVVSRMNEKIFGG
jgi:integrase